MTIGIEFLRNTKVYQEAREEAREDILTRAVPRLLAVDLTETQIAEIFGVSVEDIRRILARGEE